jgi:hypothetical protein
MKTTVGKSTPKGQMYGIPQTGPTGPNYQGIDTMKKGGSVKKAKLAALAAPKNKITRADVIAGAKKKKIVKKQNGGQTAPDKSLFPGSELVGFLGAGLGTALAARRQNNPQVQQKQKERIIAREQKRAMRKKQ